MKSANYSFPAIQSSWFILFQRSLIFSSSIALIILLCSAVFGPKRLDTTAHQNEATSAKMQLTVQQDEVQNDTYQVLQNVTFQIGDDHYLIGNVLFASPEFFERYDLNFIVGDPDLAFKNGESIIITEEVADKIFKSKNPDCQIIRCGTENVECQLKVTGVIEDLPSNGGIEVDYIVSAELLKKL